MNQEIKTKWLEALRSGKYVQGKGYLKKLATTSEPVKYCCLGVLCELAKDAGIVKERAVYNDSVHVADFAGAGEGDEPTGEVLPQSVVDWADIGEINPDVSLGMGEFDAITYSLATLNDQGKSFAEIADLIEAQL